MSARVNMNIGCAGHEIRPARKSHVLPRWQCIRSVMKRQSARLFKNRHADEENFGKSGFLASSEGMNLILVSS